MSGPDPAVAAARRAVREALADVPTDGLVLVACSGGTDSLALAAATAFVASRAGYRAGAVVVDHGLQAGSAEVARRAGEACERLGLAPVRVVRVDVREAAGVAARDGWGGPEASARRARYAALEDRARDLGAAAVLLGHTLDDQAETVLLGLARGSGARSLAGMAPRRDLLRRPLLGLTREQTARACAALGLEPWHDPTNTPAGPEDSGAPLRSRVRHHVLPVLEDVLGPGVRAALARSADQLREDADALDALADALLTRARAGGDVRGLDLDCAVLAQAPTAVRRRALRAALVAAGAPSGSVHRVHVEAVDALVQDWRGQGPVAVPGGGAVRRRYGRLTSDG